MEESKLLEGMFSVDEAINMVNGCETEADLQSSVVVLHEAIGPRDMLEVIKATIAKFNQFDMVMIDVPELHLEKSDITLIAKQTSSRAEMMGYIINNVETSSPMDLMNNFRRSIGLTTAIRKNDPTIPEERLYFPIITINILKESNSKAETHEVTDITQTNTEQG